MVALFVASHYRNTPNDLLLMADAPAHQLFVLLAPVDQASNTLPTILAVAQARRRARRGAGSRRGAVTRLRQQHCAVFVVPACLRAWMCAWKCSGSFHPRLRGPTWACGGVRVEAC
jgi:hypothetical protein